MTLRAVVPAVEVLAVHSSAPAEDGSGAILTMFDLADGRTGISYWHPKSNEPMVIHVVAD